MRRSVKSRSFSVRKRNNDRNNKKIKIDLHLNKNAIIISMSILLVVIASFITIVAIRDHKVSPAARIIDSANGDDSNSKKEDGTIGDNSKGDVKIAILGDLMLGGETQNAIAGDYILPFNEVAPLTAKADITFASLGAPIYEPNESEWGKLSIKKTVTNSFNVLGIDILGIANDHIMDYGAEGIISTRDVISGHGLDYTGIDKALTIKEVNGTKVGILAVTDVFIGNKQTYIDNGVNSLNDIDIENLVSKYKAEVDVLLVSIHWGKEGSSYVSNTMIDKARSIIDAGADGIIGQHAGKLMIFETYKDKPILYGTGYFIHDTDSLSSQESAVFEMTVKGGKINQLKLTPIIIENKNRVAIAKDSAKTKILKYMSENSKTYGTDSKVTDNEIIVNY